MLSAKAGNEKKLPDLLPQTSLLSCSACLRWCGLPFPRWRRLHKCQSCFPTPSLCCSRAALAPSEMKGWGSCCGLVSAGLLLPRLGQKASANLGWWVVHFSLTTPLGKRHASDIYIWSELSSLTTADRKCGVRSWWRVKGIVKELFV